MKRFLAAAIIASCTASTFAEENTVPATEKREKQLKLSTSSNGPSKATITIEMNGKKEVRVLDLQGQSTTVTTLPGADSEKQLKLGLPTYQVAGQSGEGHVVATGTGTINPPVRLGVAADELSEELAAQLPLANGTGVIVRHVAQNSPAAKVGVQKHDVLLKLDDQIITDGRQLQKLVRSKKVGDLVELTLLRKGEEQKLKATLEVGSEPGNDRVDFPILDLGSGKVGMQDILKNYSTALGSSGGRANILITKPDGSVVTDLDTGDIKMGELLKKADEALKKSNITSDILKRIEEAVSQVRTNTERASQQAAEAMKRAEEAARRATEAAKRAEANVEREREQAPPTQ